MPVRKKPLTSRRRRRLLPGQSAIDDYALIGNLRTAALVSRRGSIDWRPQDLQILYGIGGERRPIELELDWLAGYRHSRPVRIGNAATNQFQLDVYGEVLDSMHLARSSGFASAEDAWRFQLVPLRFLESAWREPTMASGKCGPPQHFAYSKVMASVAFDRAVKAVERFKLPGPVEHWRRLRKTIHAQICRHGVDPDKPSRLPNCLWPFDPILWSCMALRDGKNPNISVANDI